MTEETNSGSYHDKERYAVVTPSELHVTAHRDTVLLRIPPQVAVKPEEIRAQWMHMMAITALHEACAGKGEPYELTGELWSISNQPDEIATWVPHHDCKGCWAAIEKARKFVKQDGSIWVAMGCLDYLTYEPPNVVKTGPDEPFLSDEELTKRFAEKVQKSMVKKAEQIDIKPTRYENGIPVFEISEDQVGDIPTLLAKLVEDFGKPESEQPE